MTEKNYAQSIAGDLFHMIESAREQGVNVDAGFRNQAMSSPSMTLTYMFLLMFAVTKWYQKYKSTARRGAMLHWLWFHGMYDVGGRFKNGLARRYVA